MAAPRHIAMRAARALASPRALSSATTTTIRHAALTPRAVALRPAALSFSPIRTYSSAPSDAAPSDAAPSPPDYLDAGELKVFNMLLEGLKPTRLEVQDVSGGCGSMYALDIVSEKFAGLPIVKQHRLVNSVLGEEVKKWHGVQMKTKAP